VNSQAPTADDPIRAAWREASVSPLWESRVAHNAKTFVERPAVWRWTAMAPLIADALGRKSTEVIERRVLSLINPEPAMGNCTTSNLNAGLQILGPGEVARPHRHSMNALRFVLQGTGAATVVDGKNCPMEEGDLIITPGWTWHEHVHRGTDPVVWLDVLDASLHRYLYTDSFEAGPPNQMPNRTSDGAFAFANLVPDGTERGGTHSPVFRYPWADAQGAVAAAPPGKDGARRVRYVNPETGGSVMSLLDCYLMQIDPDRETIGVRTTCNAVCAVVEGHGSSRIGEETVAWAPRDVFTLPHGSWITHRAETTARLFVTTDREIYRRLDLLKEEVASRP
jgi:gentisate 1,2-dioxygenase